MNEQGITERKIMSGCDYRAVPEDPAIRVCATHDPDFGLYGDEWCQSDRTAGAGTADGYDDDEEVPDHRNDLGDWCPRSKERTADGTCPLYCREADVLAGYDAGDRDDDDEDDGELRPSCMEGSESS